jgi:hypothetical protein
VFHEPTRDVEFLLAGGAGVRWRVIVFPVLLQVSLVLAFGGEGFRTSITVDFDWVLGWLGAPSFRLLSADYWGGFDVDETFDHTCFNFELDGKA